ncbi:TetR/AcrR family transcriptional regulator [Pandoraea sp. NPDC087047]|uniref:TetR/AcrR family transcriptional regulator n=1 Tax=Pandoraea sp. NPDC087047 TaxID=3364390 RepID=UPI0038020636
MARRPKSGIEEGTPEGEATRTMLLDTAEQLFALNGIASTSIRSINDEAGYGAASVHYHFGTKAHLLRSVLLRRGAAVLATAESRIDALLAQREAPTVRDIVSAAFDPHAQLVENEPVGGGYWEQILSRLGVAGDPVLTELFGPITLKFNQALQRCYPQASSAAVVRQWYIASISIINLLGIYARLTRDDSEVNRQIREGFAASSLEFVVSGLEGMLQAQQR